MIMKKLFFFAVCMLAIASCNQGPSQAEIAANQKVDSLSQIVAQKDNEINDMLGTFGEIEEGFRQISEAESASVRTSSSSAIPCSRTRN